MDYTEYIEKKLYEKGIDNETQDYIIKYVNMNQKLFGSYIDIDKVVNRIITNLNSSISSVDKSKNPLVELFRISKTKGSWNSYDNKIMLNPIYKLLSKVSPHQKTKLDSVIFHEIDHCATTEYVKIDNNEKDQYVQKYLNNHNIRNKNAFIQKLNKLYEKVNGILAVSGIFDMRQVINNDVNLRSLNEGITAYKQEMYDKFLGYKVYSPYEPQKTVAKFIGNVIGKENLIGMHFNNDYNGIRKSFNEKTGQDLNDLVDKMNKQSMLKTRVFGKPYIKYYSKKIEKYISKYEIPNPERDGNIQDKAKSFRESLNKDYPRESKEQINEYNKQEEPNKTIEKTDDLER